MFAHTWCCIDTFVMSGLKNKFKSQSLKYCFQVVFKKEYENLQKQKLDKMLVLKIQRLGKGFKTH